MSPPPPGTGPSAGAALNNVRLEGASLRGLVDLDHAIVHSIETGSERLEGEAAHAWLRRASAGE